MAARINKIYVGSAAPYFYQFENEDIVSVNGILAVNLVGEELAVDTLTVVVNYEPREEEPFIPLGSDALVTSDGRTFCGHYTTDLDSLAWATPVWFYNNSNYIGEYFIDSVERIGRKQYQLNCVSFIGILDKEPFYGGYYTNSTFSDVVTSIILSRGLRVYQGTEYIRSDGNGYLIGLPYLKGEDRVQAHFYYEGIDGTGTTEGATSDTVYFFGYRTNMFPPRDSYCLFANISRPSAESPWEQNIQLIFKYGSQQISLCTISAGTDIYVDINPPAGEITINENQYEITQETFETYLDPLLLGAKFKASSSSYIAKKPAMQVKSYSYKVIRADTLIFNAIPCYKIINTSINGIYDSVHRTWYEGYLLGRGAEIVVDLPNFVSYTPGTAALMDAVDYASGVDTQVIKGYIPICTKREALYHAMFAYNINLIKGSDDKLLFTWIYQSSPEAISDGAIYNEGSIDYGEKTRQVEVTEHAYYSDTTVDSEVLYDNTDGGSSESVLITFGNAPIIENSLTTTGTIVIEASNANAAVVSGTGTLSGKPYTHATSVVQRINTALTEGNTVSVTDATLVNLTNSENVADRMFAYYSYKRIINNAISLNGQKCGGYYSFTDPFGRAVNAYLQKMTVNSSGNLKAECEFVADYIPVGNGSNYNHYVLLTGEGTWTVPEEVFEKATPMFRAVLISGGTGGSSGYAGQSGYQQPVGSIYTHEPLEGGAVGTNGEGGRILTVTVTEPNADYVFSCGEGGAGGAICYSNTTANAGSAGEDTIFGGYTTADGATATSGVHNFFTGATYAIKPANARANPGGGGGCPLSGSYYSYNYCYGETIADTEGMNIAQEAGIQVIASDYIYAGGTGGRTGGGFGGGAAAGMAGSDANGLNGGNGANALTGMRQNSSYGSGGYGGNGGGTGGDSGVDGGTPGSGGYGGVGGQGGDGCIIIYY